MTSPTAATERKSPEPLPQNLTSVQPGGGICYSIELAWGRLRRAYLQRLRGGYVERMAQLRSGTTDGAPHPVLDPRDLKFCRNQCSCDWEPADDPFRWRDKIPFARWGLAELLLMTVVLLAATAGLAITPWWYAALVPGVIWILVVYFFRDPPRRIPDAPGVWVSPADGRVVEITQLEQHDFIGGPAVRIGIFLSIFNVHINRAVCRSRVIRLEYHPGKFLNAMNPASAWENEALWIGLEEELPPHRPHVVRQIAGLFARRIVCNLRSGEVLDRGAQFGMIKLGSRTELILPDTGDLKIEVQLGERVRAGASIMARYQSESNLARS